MRTWGEIDLDDVHEDDILDRDKAIIELWDALEAYVKMVAMTAPKDVYEDALKHPILDKYRDFVEKSPSMNNTYYPINTMNTELFAEIGRLNILLNERDKEVSEEEFKEEQVLDEQTFRQLVAEGQELRRAFDSETARMRVITPDDMKTRVTGE